jgi:hypothetical protein
MDVLIGIIVGLAAFIVLITAVLAFIIYRLQAKLRLVQEKVKDLEKNDASATTPGPIPKRKPLATNAETGSPVETPAKPSVPNPISSESQS